MSFWARKRTQSKENSRSSFLKRWNEDFLYLEQFKALRAKFEYRVDMYNWKVVAVTSAIAGEGKTVSSVNLARNLATAGRKKVLLIDLDLRKSDLARALDMNPAPGLSEFLAGSAVLKDIVRPHLEPGLHVVPGGARTSAPADLIAGERFRSFLQQIRAHFDVVLLDTPPVIPVADTINVREQVDGFLFVYRVGHTPHPMLRQAVEEVGEKRILGVVLNGVEPRSERYYYRYYGKYYKST